MFDDIVTQITEHASYHKDERHEGLQALLLALCQQIKKAVAPRDLAETRQQAALPDEAISPARNACVALLTSLNPDRAAPLLRVEMWEALTLLVRDPKVMSNRGEAQAIVDLFNHPKIQIQFLECYHPEYSMRREAEDQARVLVKQAFFCAFIRFSSPGLLGLCQMSQTSLDHFTHWKAQLERCLSADFNAATPENEDLLVTYTRLATSLSNTTFLLNNFLIHWRRALRPDLQDLVISSLLSTNSSVTLVHCTAVNQLLAWAETQDKASTPSPDKIIMLALKLAVTFVEEVQVAAAVFKSEECASKFEVKTQVATLEALGRHYVGTYFTRPANEPFDQNLALLIKQKNVLYRAVKLFGSQTLFHLLQGAPGSFMLDSSIPNMGWLSFIFAWKESASFHALLRGGAVYGGKQYNQDEAVVKNVRRLRECATLYSLFLSHINIPLDLDEAAVSALFNAAEALFKIPSFTGLEIVLERVLWLYTQLTKEQSAFKADRLSQISGLINMYERQHNFSALFCLAHVPSFHQTLLPDFFDKSNALLSEHAGDLISYIKALEAEQLLSVGLALSEEQYEALFNQYVEKDGRDQYQIKTSTELTRETVTVFCLLMRYKTKKKANGIVVDHHDIITACILTYLSTQTVDASSEIETTPLRPLASHKNDITCALSVTNDVHLLETALTPGNALHLILDWSRGYSLIADTGKHSSFPMQVFKGGAKTSFKSLAACLKKLQKAADKQAKAAGAGAGAAGGSAGTDERRAGHWGDSWLAQKLEDRRLAKSHATQEMLESHKL
jgi:hypothetical protein